MGSKILEECGIPLILWGTLTLGLLKGVDDLCESNILFVAGDLCGDRPVLVRFLL
jgi:hypothetical protein